MLTAGGRVSGCVTGWRSKVDVVMQVDELAVLAQLRRNQQLNEVWVGV